MKNILTIGLLFIATATVKSQPPCADARSAKQPYAGVETPKSPTKVSEAIPADDHSAAGGMDRSIIYVGTNEFNLALVREGVKAA